MKTLIRKELRENLKVTALGLVVLLLILSLRYRSYTWSLKEQAIGRLTTHPLMENDFVVLIHFYCAIFGGVLGWLQAWNERHPDLWAFLVHRPISRTQIFFAKIAAGLLLYFLVPGLLLLGCVFWVAAPGHVPVPFEWGMALPLLASFLAGFVYYLAGLLAGLRQARWYASRCLGLVAALLVTSGVLSASCFWQVLIFIIPTLVVLGAAAWGAFQSQGRYEGQPWPGKAALATALGTGLAPVVLLAALLVTDMVLRLNSGESWSHYYMTVDGSIYQETVRNRGRSVSKVPVSTAPTSQPRSLIAPNPAGMIPIDLHRQKPWNQWDTYQNGGRFYRFAQFTAGIVWYHWHRYGCLAGYDLATRRFIGSLGPDGFSTALPELTVSSGRQVDHHGSTCTLATPDAVYAVDFRNRTTKRIFSSGVQRILGAADLVCASVDWAFTTVVTESAVFVLSPEGAVVFQAPFTPAPGPDSQVKIALLEPPGRFALWVTTRTPRPGKTGGSLSTRVTWFERDSSAIRSEDLAPLPVNHETLSLRDRILYASSPPLFPVVAPLVEAQLWPWAIVREMLKMSLLTALVCLPVVWWLGWRYRFSFGAKAGWTGFILLAGIPGLLAFLAVQEWPARELCLQCGKLRVVERELCEHCGASFAPPEKTGTEIFEPVGRAPA